MLCDDVLGMRHNDYDGEVGWMNVRKKECDGQESGGWQLDRPCPCLMSPQPVLESHAQLFRSRRHLPVMRRPNTVTNIANRGAIVD